MWSLRPSTLRPSTLAGQLLLLQVAVLVVVLAVSAVVSVRQAVADFRDTRSTRLTAAAEALAGIPAVQDGLDGTVDRQALLFYVQQRSDQAGASAIHLTGPDGTVLVSTDPTREGEPADLGDGDALRGRRWVGDVLERDRPALAATVPVLANNAPDESGPPAGTIVGVVSVVEDVPPLRERRTFGDLVLFLGIGLALGLAGSLLLSRLIRRRTRGLEPAEIAALADQREALLTSLREGLVALGPDDEVVLVNDSAVRLLGLPVGCTGRSVHELDLPDRVVELLSGEGAVLDEPVVVAGRLLVLNRAHVTQQGRDAGTVTTVRDRTELSALQSRLSARESVTETLRAQTHEFANQLHTISGLLQLGEPDEAASLIGTLTRRQAEISDAVRSRVADPAVAALLVAKVSLASERRVSLTLDAGSSLPRLHPGLSADVLTVLGNLVDNAVESTAEQVVVRLSTEEGGPDPRVVVVQVADTGPGVAPEHVPDLFRRGYSTKPADASGRGVGLALVQLVCERRGGSVSVHNDAGAVFTARLVDTWEEQS